MAAESMEPTAATAVERWRATIERRALQMDAAYAALGRTSRDYWSRRAERFHRATRGVAESDPFLRQLRRATGPRTSVLDVGAGTGRYTVALAPRVRQVIAVEPNDHMRTFLEREVAAHGLSNVEVLPARWEEVGEDVRGDVVLCSHVLYPIAEVEPFLRKLDRAARRRCLVYMRADHPDTITSPLWEHFHGEPRQVGPTYVAALDVLAEMGIYAEVQLTSQAPSWRYASLDEAAEEFLELLILPDAEATRAELRALLARFLVRRDGSLTLPVRRMRNAIISWSPGRALTPRPA